MTIPFPQNRLNVRLARNADDLQACLDLRARCFRRSECDDTDAFDAHCRHLMVCDGNARVMATARFRVLQDDADVCASYTAQHYDLNAFLTLDDPMLEIGRFCLAPGSADTDVLRIAWAALTRIVDDAQVRFLFGCTSFQGTEPELYGQALQTLAQKHLGPETLRPKAVTEHAIPLQSIAPVGQTPMPNLLRAYLTMGGWVGDTLTVDHQMRTMHIFTCLDVATVPPARARALRALADGIDLA
ncbi:GNAT family N-acetyltransferase [Yoonia litorea]|uniref:L-ornithine N(alpha)-acyltransferase n=1 Tax=Yoonia litorea TaxID=1123755 RepID=A0A1I6LZQ6_9RHOB|nr:GNAT family N-acetyltransferase [Yoonia litorea]SFS08893.1 ornithine-acyl[acyl carrier protein] N-acyltransferase [Yoonia litorea]